MRDCERDKLIEKSVYVYIAILVIIPASSIILGKAAGVIAFLMLHPVYSIYYIFMYYYTSKGYKDEVKKISAFGTIGRGTLKGAFYYLSIFTILSFCYVLVAPLFES